jgi:hypothetical protein
MKISIDNLQGEGPGDYTRVVDATIAPRVERKINQPSQFHCSLLALSSDFVIPMAGARVTLEKSDGTFLFTGYLTQSPSFEYLGWGESGPAYRYALVAESDEILLNQKALPNRAPFVARSAGSALKQLAEDLLPGVLDTSGVEEVGVLAYYEVNPQQSFSYHAGEIALAARASYRAMNGALSLSPAGAATHWIDENDADFSPTGLKLSCRSVAVNDVTVIGLDEPQAYVRDYFVGDGLSTRFYLSQMPFQPNRRALINEKFVELDPATWMVQDPASAISVAAQALQINGGSGQDGKSTVSFVEQVELGGAVELQHGDLSFTGASQGVIGGLYGGSISEAGCLAGFQVTPSGAGSNIRALINGSATGPTVATVAGHRYLMTTYLYSMEVYRSQQTYHSSKGNGWGGATVPANLRVVLEIQEINPAVPSSLLSPATVLFDDVIANAPGFCTYALVNAVDLHCSIGYTYVAHVSLAEVRTALLDSTYSTRLVESPSEGGECAIVSSTTLDFYPQYVPALNALIVASYRGSGRAVAEVGNSAAIASLQDGSEDGVRSIVRTMKAPSARTQADCENAALAILDDAAGLAWLGTYENWSDFFPGGARDVFPGDAVEVNVGSRNARFNAIVRRVKIELLDPANDRGMYTIEFANDLAEPLARRDEVTGTAVPLQDLPVRLATTDVGSYYLANLTNAHVTQVSSTTVQVDAGTAPPNGWGIEVRAHDYGWGPANDRNLLGRFSTRTFTLPRLSRSQSYFLRLYDTSSPARYSRYAAALHVDSPL